MFNRNEVREAQKIAASYNITYLGTYGANPKTVKSDKQTKYLTWIMYLAPHTLSGYNVCPCASKGCSAACLNRAGRGRYSGVQEARIRRTKFFFEYRDAFKICLWDELRRHCNICKTIGKLPLFRLNGTSDIVWEKVFPELFTYFKDCLFYDYTKIPRRMMTKWDKPKNYYLLFSRSESNDKQVRNICKDNPSANIAVVFKETPKEWLGRPVLDGDLNDCRVLDKNGVIVGLKPKGRAIHDTSGFVVNAT
ncbi:MAG: hypothetical protein WC942_06830 [Clostridia bacterium]|jgi:hypothetical protein